MLTAEQAEILRFAKNGQMDPGTATRDDNRDALCPLLDGAKLLPWRKPWATFNYVTSKSPVIRILRKKTLMEKSLKSSA